MMYTYVDDAVVPPPPVVAHTQNLSDCGIAAPTPAKLHRHVRPKFHGVIKISALGRKNERECSKRNTFEKKSVKKESGQNRISILTSVSAAHAL